MVGERMSLNLLFTLAFTNGLLLALCRVLNGRLSETIGSIRASFWNHVVGFSMLLVVVAASGELRYLETLSQVPVLGYAGGVLGAGFVALNSFVLPRMGVMRTSLLVIAGQMLTGTVLDIASNTVRSVAVQVLGVALIVLGMLFTKLATRGILQ